MSRAPVVLFCLALGALLGAWAVVMTIDAQNAAEERAEEEACLGRLRADGIPPGGARLPDIERLCGPLLLAAIRDGRVHEPVAHVCVGAGIRLWSAADIGALDRACSTVLPTWAWSEAGDRSLWRHGAAVLALVFFCAPLALWRPRCWGT